MSAFSRIVIIKKTDNKECWQGSGETGTPIHCFENVLIKWCTHSVKQLSYVPDIPLLGIYSRELKKHSYTKTCTGMFRAALFTITKRCKKPNPNIH